MWRKHQPIWMRVGITKWWFSERFGKSKKQAGSLFIRDIELRNYIDTFFGRASIAKVILRQAEDDVELIIFTAKPGLLMGKDGDKIKSFDASIKKKFNVSSVTTIKSVKIPELSAAVMAENMAMQLERRMPYRRVAKQILEKVREKWALGIKIQIAWRLWGSDMSRTEKFIDWRVPLQTFRADIDYKYTIAHTKYGVVGIKVWIAKKQYNFT